jgi:hypothetical protein
MMKEEKKFLIPVAEIVEFNNDDIVTLSGEDEIGGISYEELL